MSKELYYRDTQSGSTLYAVLYDQTNQVYKPGSGFVDLVAADWSLYKIALAETPSGSFRYCADMPTLAKGGYRYEVYDGSGLLTDSYMWDNAVLWSGSAETRAATAEEAAAIEAKTNQIDTGGTMTVVSPIATSNLLTIVRGDDFAATLDLPVDAGDVLKSWFAVKSSSDDTDASALILIVDGALTKVNGAAPTEGQTGSITNVLQVATVELSATATAALVQDSGVWGFQIETADGIQELFTGSYRLAKDVVRATV